MAGFRCAPSQGFAQGSRFLCQRHTGTLPFSAFMEKRNVTSLVIALTAVGMLAGCATKPPPPPPPKPAPAKEAPP